MANTFKTISTDDMTNTKTFLYEQIPVTGTIVSGTYSSSAGETNILYYSHGMFQTVFDYPYLSSSANNLFDITFGASSGSIIFNASTAEGRSKKLSLYNQMAKILAGYDSTGSIALLDRDGSPETLTDFYPNGYFLSFSRLLVKDEIKKGTFRLRMGLGNTDALRFNLTGTIYDHSGTLNPQGYLTNSPAGEYGILFLSESIKDASNFPSSQTDKRVGLIFYQAGVVFLASSLFGTYNASNSPFTNMTSNTFGQLNNACNLTSSGTGFANIQALATTGTIDQMGNAFRRRISNLEFQNTTELNSTIYFLRINNNEFNYSSNPTYIDGGKIVVKQDADDSPVSYITTAGLYSPDNELLAVAKLSQPLKKTEEQSLILRVRLDY